MAGEWDDLASKYRDGFLKLLWEHTRLDPTASRTVVDFGCGSGLLTEAMRRLSTNDDSSKFVCIDAAPAMIQAVHDKIKSGGWDNVRAYGVALANYETAGDDEIKEALDAMKGTVDLIVASSVMSFVPADDLPATMKVLGAMLKPGGIFCHSDWPQSAEKHPNGFTEKKAKEMYQMGGLTYQSSTVVEMDMGQGYKGEVFLGVAIKQ